ncbi:HesB/IscA family protein [Larsenimonas rhizosphaerae]|uniref:Iron-sulfur cluster assembly accessory protein n=1 Tax=Larsenimonas rhizosphaerae TaxID=2944682 RepID=A0AA41ZMG2_9GAMM|nr:iron-sulfur cluster assembly accessory protein [Larsenimonas rhizosphaerae]MCM2129902.1 iron-sulfur cluster assembly accessory protein [Larsenimonas rhizosphaerae]MCX2524563.1 iron-sulfur cluster assembly accessory protein [Larsenimonas rhizosphaerae]
MARIGITTAAARQINTVLDERGKGLGLRVNVKPSGCSGYSYVLDFADDTQPDEHMFEEHGARVFIGDEALTILDGTEVDYVNEGLNRFFKFNNPNVKDECGCGESFSV